MLITKEQILITLSKMSVSDVMDLVSMIEKKFNISSNTPILSENKKKSENKKEQVNFDVFLNSVGINKIAVIKSIRSILNLGLKESKDLVESSPVIIKKKINKLDALNIKSVLEKIGAVVEVK